MPTPDSGQREDPIEVLSANATPDSAEAGAHVPNAERGATEASHPEAGAPEFSGPASHPGHPANSGQTGGDPPKPGVG